MTDRTGVDDAINASNTTANAGPSARDVAIGCGAMVVSVLFFTLLDSVNKALVETYSPFFLSWTRSVGQVLILLLLVPWLGASKLFKTERPLLHLARGLCIAGVSLSVTFAVRHLPLVETYVVAFLAPFLATMIAAVFIGERASPFQWFVITCGFAGVLIALRPGTPEASWYFVYPLCFATFNSIYFVLTRLAARTETWQSQVFYVGVFASLALTTLLPWHWETPTLPEWGLISLTGLFGTCGHLMLIFAFSRAPTAIVSPMVYSQIIWSAVIGYVIFNDVPLATTWIGAVVVVAAGIALIRIEARNRTTPAAPSK